jgi:hypothetical protein
MRSQYAAQSSSAPTDSGSSIGSRKPKKRLPRRAGVLLAIDLGEAAPTRRGEKRDLTRLEKGLQRRYRNVPGRLS